MEQGFDTLKRDCRHFRTDRPCTPHKLRGVVCASCDEYDPAGFRIAIVKLAAAGDVLRTTAFLPGLRRRYPDARIRWLTLPSAVPLFDGNELVDELFVTYDGTSLPAALAAVPQDLILCPDADLTTVALAAGLGLRDGGRRVGFTLEDGEVQPLSDAARRWFLMGILDTWKKANTATYQDLVGALLELPVPITDRPMLVLSERERRAAREWLASVAPEREGRVVGINTGAGGRWPRKQWTLDGQVGLIRHLHAAGHTTLLLGGPDEVGRHRELLAACPGACVDAGNDNTLRDFFARIDLCDAVVTGDTMALHAATALGKKVVATFGPTSSAEIELYEDGAKVFTDQLDCLCCYSDCRKTPSCQDLISVDMVVAALEPLLAPLSREQETRRPGGRPQGPAQE